MTPTGAPSFWNYTARGHDNNDDDDCTSGEPLWWLGLVLGLLGSVFINMGQLLAPCLWAHSANHAGNNFQSLGMHQLVEMAEPNQLNSAESATNDREEGVSHCQGGTEERMRDKHLINPAKSTTWRVGTTIFVSGALLNFASYAFAAQSMLASLESIQFVLDKRITWRMYGGTVMICVGTVVAVLHSSREELCASAADLIRSYTENVAYQIFLVLTVLLAILLQSIHVLYQRSVDNSKPLPFAKTVLPVTYAAFSAIFGTQSVVQAKCLAELLQGSLPTVYPVFLHWFTYVALFAWVGLVIVWLYRMNEALGLYDPIFIIPLLQVDFILFAIIAGGIYFREFADFTMSMWIGFTSGIIVVFIGLFMLAPTESETKDANSFNRCRNQNSSSRSKIVPFTEKHTAVSQKATIDATILNRSDSLSSLCATGPGPSIDNNEAIEGAEHSQHSTSADPDICARRRLESTVECPLPYSSNGVHGQPLVESSSPSTECHNGNAKFSPPQVTVISSLQIGSVSIDNPHGETPRSKSLPLTGKVCAHIASKKPTIRVYTRPLHLITSISAQINKNELDSERAARLSFDESRRASDIGVSSSWESSQHRNFSETYATRHRPSVGPAQAPDCGRTDVSEFVNSRGCRRNQVPVYESDEYGVAGGAQGDSCDEFEAERDACLRTI